MSRFLRTKINYCTEDARVRTLLLVARRSGLPCALHFAGTPAIRHAGSGNWHWANRHLALGNRMPNN
jgi:hypothetical protein